MKKGAIVFIAICTVLYGCNEQKTAVEQDKQPMPTVKVEAAPTFDISSPDRALKSWWKLIDIREQERVDDCESSRVASSKFIQYLPNVAQEDALAGNLKGKFSCLLNTYERDISDIKVETDTRAIAIVKIKNNTPPPTGAIAEEYHLQWRKEGETFKYLLEKNSEGWKVSQVYKYNKINERRGWDVWEKEYKEQKTPSYPSLVSRQ